MRCSQFATSCVQPAPSWAEAARTIAPRSPAPPTRFPSLGHRAYTRRVRLRAIDLADVLVYLVVLGAFIQLLPSVISESFLLALLTAILLKCVLEVVLLAKQWAISRIAASATVIARVVNVGVLVLILPGSKLLVLELVALVFGDAVQLGGFFEVTGLIIVLMLARRGMRRLIATPGKPDALSAGSTRSSALK